MENRRFIVADWYIAAVEAMLRPQMCFIKK